MYVTVRLILEYKTEAISGSRLLNVKVVSKINDQKQFSINFQCIDIMGAHLTERPSSCKSKRFQEIMVKHKMFRAEMYSSIFCLKQ